ncbi:uncharacterized protein LOC124457257 [Xenia sp. Carnegie-2017]|uniref:uncharacterized protein LOC124457257 n=1 Tax=Xenia sp. Carnegie-2017 TaxID=2897299 RepID=UPI001F046586|nr:uncharacterized protein LOC124457257 [Xenia sp. Carnegie-2017]
MASLNIHRTTLLNDDEKRWCVYGIVLNHVLIPAIHNFPSPKYSLHDLHYENINNNETKDKKKFNYKITSHVDFGKLFLQNMAKFNSYDSCDASAVLNLLEWIPIFSNLVQNAAKIVRDDRNSWAHCSFLEFGGTDFHQKIDNMKQLVKELCLETKVLNDINYWKNQALTLWTNDRALREELKGHINSLSSEIEEIKFENEACKKLLQDTLNKSPDFFRS